MLGACSGGGTSPAAHSPANLVQGSLRLVVPPRGTAADRARSFVSPSAASASITVSGISGSVVANIGASSPDCTTSEAGRTCNVAIEAPPGSDTIGVTLYDGENAGGKVLGTGTSTLDVTGNGFSDAVVVNGSVASLALFAQAAKFTAGTPGSTTISVAAKDADGNVIAGTFAAPIALVVSDPSAFTLSPASIGASNQTVTLAYDGAAGVGSVTVGASAAGVAASAVVPVTLTVAGGLPLTLSTTFLQLSGIGVASNPIAIAGPAGTSFALIGATSSDTDVATASIEGGGKELVVTSAGTGSATITVVPSDGSAGAATLTVHVQTTVIDPSLRRSAIGGVR